MICFLSEACRSAVPPSGGTTGQGARSDWKIVCQSLGHGRCQVQESSLVTEQGGSSTEEAGTARPSRDREGRHGAEQVQGGRPPGEAPEARARPARRQPQRGHRAEAAGGAHGSGPERAGRGLAAEPAAAGLAVDPGQVHTRAQLKDASGRRCRRRRGGSRPTRGGGLVPGHRGAGPGGRAGLEVPGRSRQERPRLRCPDRRRLTAAEWALGDPLPDPRQVPTHTGNQPRGPYTLGTEAPKGHRPGGAHGIQWKM